MVLTYGSGFVRLGWADVDARPRATFPAVTGRLKQYTMMMCKSHYAGDEVLARREQFRLIRPVERGRVANWDEVEYLWNHAFYNEIRVAPEEHALVLAELLSTLQRDRQCAAQIAFETFSVPALHLAQDSVLALMGSGRLTGLAVSVGHGATCAVPVCEGHALTHYAASAPLGGMDITQHLSQLLQGDDSHHFWVSNSEALRRAMEALAYVAYDCAQEATKPAAVLAQSFVLPTQSGSQTLTLATERFLCAEVLFRPSLVGTPDSNALQHVVCEALRKCTDADLHAAMVDNIVLWGGVANLPGLSVRLHKELRALLPPQDERLLVISAQDTHELTYVGGTIVATHPSFAAKCTTRDEWQEEGATKLHRRCF